MWTQIMPVLVQVRFSFATYSSYQKPMHSNTKASTRKEFTVA